MLPYDPKKRNIAAIQINKKSDTIKNLGKIKTHSYHIDIYTTHYHPKITSDTHHPPDYEYFAGTAWISCDHLLSVVCRDQNSEYV